MSEDPIDRCGWKWLRLFKNTDNEPYHQSCSIHDQETTKGSVPEQISTLDEVQRRFEDNIERERAARYSGLGAYRLLGSFYKLVTRYATRFFWDGRDSYSNLGWQQLPDNPRIKRCQKLGHSFEVLRPSDSFAIYTCHSCKIIFYEDSSG